MPAADTRAEVPGAVGKPEESDEAEESAAVRDEEVPGAPEADRAGEPADDKEVARVADVE